jgi:hypothetical protein
MEMGLPNITKFKDNILRTLSRKKKQTTDKLEKIRRLKDKQNHQNQDIDLENALEKSIKYELHTAEETKNEPSSFDGFSDNDFVMNGNKKYFKELN